MRSGRHSVAPPWKHDLPAYSPLSLPSTLSAALYAGRVRPDPRPDLQSLLRQTYAADRALLFGSGTQALQQALVVAGRALGRPPAVALPSYSCFDLATAAVGVEARVWIYDVDPATLAPDEDSLCRALEEGARIVVVSPLFGIPVDWDGIETLVNRHGALAIEDAAQAYGSVWRGRRFGSLGKLSVLSFGRGKGWTGGRGGALLVRDAAFEEDGAHEDPTASYELKNVLAATAQWLLGRRSLYALPASAPWLGLGVTRYRQPETPHAIARSAAALALRTRDASEAEVVARRRNASALMPRIGSHRRIGSFELPAGSEAGFLRLPVRLENGMESFPDPGQARRLGVAPGYPAVLPAIPQLRPQVETRSSQHWRGGEELVRQLVTLPTHSRHSRAGHEGLMRLLDRVGD